MRSARSNREFAPRWVHFLFGFLFLGGILFLGFVPAQKDFLSILLPYLGTFGLAIFAFAYANDSNSLRFWLGVAIMARLLLVFSFPNLSDDIYRFVWDGRLINAGLNPFNHLPSYYLEEVNTVNGITQSLYEQLNSPNYFTIYPPLAQLSFATATWLFPSSLWGSALVMKLFLFAFEVGNLVLIGKLLQHFSLNANNLLLYALNPLILIEISGNLHFEGAMIFFLLLAYWLLIQSKWQLSAIFFALSIASKLLPLMFLPFLLRRLGWKRAFFYYLFLGFTLVLLFAPLLSTVFFNNFGDSLNLYFRRFEFNGSIFNLAKWIGYQRVGYNLIKSIGPLLALCTLFGILLAMLIERKPNWRTFPLMCLLAISLYLFNTPTVHPWYVCLPLVLCLFTDFRYPIIWSVLIVFTYVNYSYPDYYENKWVIWVEYGIVWLLIAIEWRKSYLKARSTEVQPPPL